MTPVIEIKKALETRTEPTTGDKRAACVMAPSQLEAILDFFVEEEPIRMGISG